MENDSNIKTQPDQVILFNVFSTDTQQTTQLWPKQCSLSFIVMITWFLYTRIITEALECV